MLAPDVYIARSPEIAARMLGGEMMIMSTRDSTLFTLNEVACAIWQSADGVTSLEEIIDKHICGEFDVEQAVALHDARELVEQLASHGILLTSESPI